MAHEKYLVQSTGSFASKTDIIRMLRRCPEYLDGEKVYKLVDVTNTFDVKKKASKKHATRTKR